MQASETKLEQIIDTTRQYLVPLFQRSYSWQKSEWQDLWDDLMELYSSENPRPHFMGSIVTMPMMSKPEEVSKYLLIDGQQRLTTIFVILAVLRDAVRQSNEELAAEINDTFLVNRFKKGSDYYKLQPTQVDRLAFQQIIRSEPSLPENNLLDCYHFFEKKVRQRKSLDCQKVKNTICNNLSLVSVVLSVDDDPYLVFESLNAKGKPLTQSDLIRNYFFMRIPESDQQPVYDRYWQPMENLLTGNLTEFIRHYLTRNGVDVKKSDVYFEIKDKVSNSDALSCLQDLSTFSTYYSRLLDPSREPEELVRQCLHRLNRLEVATVYPFLLNCYDDWMKHKITEQEFIAILQILENFILRRFVCNVQTRGLNRVFAALYSQVSKETDLDSGNFVERLKLTLQHRDYPKDSEFRPRLLDVKLYGGNRSEKGRFILESIEEFFGHKERVSFDKLTIEHVMPQTTDTNQVWQEHLGENWAVTYELFCHTLGNLTLTAYNSELSDKPFEEKQKMLADSNLQLNKYFRAKSAWRREDIEERAEYLADIALKIWSYFGDESVKPSKSNGLKGTIPKLLICFGQEYPIKSWRDVMETTLNVISEMEPDAFREIAKQFPRFVGWDEKDFRSVRKLRNGAFIEVNLSARDIHSFCTKAIEAADLSSEEWRVVTQESSE